MRARYWYVCMRIPGTGAAAGPGWFACGARSSPAFVSAAPGSGSVRSYLRSSPWQFWQRIVLDFWKFHCLNVDGPARLAIIASVPFVPARSIGWNEALYGLNSIALSSTCSDGGKPVFEGSFV